MVVKFSEIQSSLDTGDIVLFSSNYLISRAIQLLTHSAYSHIGMIARYPDENGSLCFWEATTLKQLIDKQDHELHAGVRLVSLDKLFAIYAKLIGGEFRIRRLKADRTSDFRLAFREFVKQADARPMAGDLSMALSFTLGRIFSMPTGSTRTFCSELIAETYQYLGLLAADRPPNYYAPRDFSMGNTGLQLLGGAQLGEEMMVLWDVEQAKAANAAGAKS